MFGIVLTIASTLMQLYVFWRAAAVPLIARRVPPKVLISVGVILWAIFAFGRTLGHDNSGTLAGVIELFSMGWMVLLFLTSVAILLVDIVTAFGFLFRRIAPMLRGWAMVTGVVLTLIAQIQGLRPPSIVSYDLSLPDLPASANGTVIVAMSDLHLGALLGKDWLAARVGQVMAEHPDVIVLLGDLFEGHGQPQRELRPELRRLSAPLGVFAVTGNHEFHGGRDSSMVMLEEAGVQILHDRFVEVRQGLVIAGVDDLTSRRRSGQGGDPIGKALAGRPAGAAILLSHTPWQAERAASAGAGLMLSGHTHGGQVWPFDYLVRLVYPFLGGRYEVGGMSVIVCRGTGTWGPRMRLWRRSEILRVTVHTREHGSP